MACWFFQSVVEHLLAWPGIEPTTLLLDPSSQSSAFDLSIMAIRWLLLSFLNAWLHVLAGKGWKILDRNIWILKVEIKNCYFEMKFLNGLWLNKLNEDWRVQDWFLPWLWHWDFYKATSVPKLPKNLLINNKVRNEFLFGYTHCCSKINHRWLSLHEIFYTSLEFPDSINAYEKTELAYNLSLEKKTF